MSQIRTDQQPALGSAFVGILVVSLLLLGAMNFLADR